MINKIIIKALFVAVLFQSCVPDFNSTTIKDRLFLKEIDKPPIKLEWFYYSAVSFTTPDYVTLEKDKIIDTICIASNVADLKFHNNKIIIGYYGSPQRYRNEIKIPATVAGYEILIDTTYTTESLTAPRKFYKKE